MTKSPDETLTERDVSTYAGPPQLWATIVVDGAVSMQPLPPRGRLVIGRSSSAQLRIDSPKLSRQHAVLHIGDGLRVEDLGSVNGTRVAGRRLAENEIVSLSPGEAIELGSVMIVVQRAAAERPRWGVKPAEDSPALRGAPLLPTGGPMAQLMKIVERVSAGTIHVLITGETGSGKEVIAERIHALSARAARPLVRLNCAALSETLLESELFGHEKGAFTGADRANPGLLQSATGGTVFLDEIGDMPLSLQAKLLRVIEAKEVLPVGAVTPRPIDVRFVAATHQDLLAASTRGTFRQDLYFRLNGVTLIVPPLRERLAELEPLALAFIARASSDAGRRAPKLSRDAVEVLSRHAWPGNVRELRNVIERAVLFCEGPTIEAEHIAFTQPSAAAAPAVTTGVPSDLRRDIKDRERAAIVAALEQTRGNQTEAARILGISRRALVARLDEFNLPRPRKR
jgi:two-component system, NtrC family, response regulator AtoC